MLGKRSGVDKHIAHAHDGRPAPFASTAIIQFGILCCAVTMVIVLAVALVASSQPLTSPFVIPEATQKRRCPGPMNTSVVNRRDEHRAYLHASAFMGPGPHFARPG